MAKAELMTAWESLYRNEKGGVEELDLLQAVEELDCGHWMDVLLEACDERGVTAAKLTKAVKAVAKKRVADRKAAEKALADEGPDMTWIDAHMPGLTKQANKDKAKTAAKKK